jgi:hypothetical protein
VGYEVSVTDLFDTKNTWPDEQYNLDNIDTKLVQSGNYFTLIIDNKKYIDLNLRVD